MPYLDKNKTSELLNDLQEAVDGVCKKHQLHSITVSKKINLSPVNFNVALTVRATDPTDPNAIKEYIDSQPMEDKVKDIFQLSSRGIETNIIGKTFSNWDAFTVFGFDASKRYLSLLTFRHSNGKGCRFGINGLRGFAETLDTMGFKP